MAAGLFAAAALGLAACGRSSEPGREETMVLSMGTGPEGSHTFLAGAAVASAISNGDPGSRVSIEISKGSPVNAVNVDEGKLDLAMISGDIVYDAVNGLGSFDGEKMENLCVLAACYPECSQWIAAESSGLLLVNDLKGKRISAGTAASATARASKDVFEAVGIDPENTEICELGLSEGADGLRNETLDGIHGFSVIPSEAFEVLAGEKETVLLNYTEDELTEILKSQSRYCRLLIPAETYPGQDEEYDTFGVKVLLCAGKDMDEELAYRITKALDEKGPAYTGGHKFMALMQDKDFLCSDLPAPLHPGAERYYREMEYIK